MSDEHSHHSKKKKSKKSSSHSDEETAKSEKVDSKIEHDDEEKRKEHKRKHKKHKHDEKSDDEEGEREKKDKETSAPTCKNKKTDEKAEDSTLKLDVHSANNWEKAELGGDEKRKLKFLKLMGAAKHKDSATSEEIVQHQHSRPTKEIKKIDEDLEKQFTESLTSKINRTNHVGLGFGGTSGFAPKPQSNTHKKFDDDDDKEPQKKTDTPSTSTSTEVVKEDPKLKFIKMTFVKSNN